MVATDSAVLSVGSSVHNWGRPQETPTVRNALTVATPLRHRDRMVATDSAVLSVGSSVHNWGSTSKNAHGQKRADRGYPTPASRQDGSHGQCRSVRGFLSAQLGIDLKKRPRSEVR